MGRKKQQLAQMHQFQDWLWCYFRLALGCDNRVAAAVFSPRRVIGSETLWSLLIEGCRKLALKVPGWEACTVNCFGHAADYRRGYDFVGFHQDRIVFVHYYPPGQTKFNTSFSVDDDSVTVETYGSWQHMWVDFWSSHIQLADILDRLECSFYKKAS